MNNRYSRDLTSLPAERSSAQVSKISIYADSLWDRSADENTPRRSSAIIDFSRINIGITERINLSSSDDLLTSYKDFAYTLIWDPPPSRPKWTTIVQVLRRRGPLWLIRFMFYQRIRNFAELTEADFTEFLAWISAMPGHDGSASNYEGLRSRVKGLDWLSDQRSKMPNGLQFQMWEQQGSREAWLRSHVCCKRASTSGRTPEMPDEVAAGLLRAAINELTTVRRHEECIAARECWHARKDRKTVCFCWSAYGYQDYYDFRRHKSSLIAASYILIAMMTGMRLHEILALPADPNENWHEEEYLDDGISSRHYFVRSYTSKLHPAPARALWQTIPITRMALEAMRIVAPNRSEERGALLFHALGKRCNATSDSMSENNISFHISSFCRRHNINWHGKVYIPSTHQFRRKYARLLIRQGLGLREIQDQLKHFDINMTRLYSDANLYIELESEKFNLSRDIYDELLKHNRPLIGGGASEIEHLRQRYLGLTKSDRRRFLDDLPKNALIDQVEHGLCLYKAERAVCGGDKVNCDPVACRNSVVQITDQGRDLFGRKRENERLLCFFGDQPLKAAHLKRQLSIISRLLDQLSRKQKS